METIAEHCKNFYHFYQMNTPFDVTLVSNNGLEIEAHKLVLASVSSVFCSIFNGSFRKSEVIIIEMDYKILKSLVKCAYTCRLSITDHNIEKFLKAANMYDLNYMKKRCHEFIKENINHTNCVRFMQTSKFLSDKIIYRFCWLYFLKNFATIVNSDIALAYLYEFNFYDVVEFIANDDLVIDSEDKIFDFIIGWINYNSKKRMHLLSDLIKYLRLNLISKVGLKRIYDEPLVRKNKDLLYKRTEIINLLFDSNHPNVSGRNFSNMSNIIFAINGGTKNGQFCVKYMDIRNEDCLKWKSCDHLFFCPPRNYTSMVVSENGIILAIGGVDSSGKDVNLVDELNLKSTSKQWVPTTPLNRPRIDFAVCTHKQYIYVIGGVDILARHRLNSVEYYDTILKVWKKIKPMPTARDSCSADIYENQLYVFGGDNGNDLATVECYDFKEKCWKILNLMPICNWGMSIRRIENVIYLIGGNKAPHRVFKFDLHDFKWDEMPNMQLENQYDSSSLVIKKNDLFVFVNYYGDIQCERYDTDKKQWQLVDKAKSFSDRFEYGCIIHFNDKTLKSYGIHL